MGKLLVVPPISIRFFTVGGGRSCITAGVGTGVWDDSCVPAQEEGEEAKCIGTLKPPNNENCRNFLFFGGCLYEDM